MNALCLLACLAPSAAPPAPPRVEDFALRDAEGRNYRLSTDSRGRKAVVVVFLSVDCPLAKLYAPTLNHLSDLASKQKGASLIAIAPGPQEDAALARYARQHSLSFPLLKDPGSVIADRFGARRGPEAFVLDQSRRVVYRGRINDQYGVGIQKEKPTREELRQALIEALENRPVRVVFTQAVGCPLPRADRRTTTTEITYTRDIAPIIQRRCQACHRPGQSGPFALTCYREAAAWAGAMREAINDGRMPPWGADPSHGKFANDRSMTASEKDLLTRWIDGGCPEGDPRHLQPPATFRAGWTIPGPDAVVSMPAPFTVPADGVVEYQYFRVDPGFKEDRWVKAAEIRPGNGAVVHHCNIFLQPPGSGGVEDLRETGKLGSYCLTMTAPGTPPMTLPDGMAKRIPAGWKIVFVMHYQTVGSVQQDQTTLGLTFADPKSVRQEVATKLMYDENLRIPPREKHHTVSQTWQAKQDVLLLSFFPHMHLRGKSFRYDLIHPDGREEILLNVPRYDFNWQHRYVLAEPLRVTKGARIRTTGVYDNSADNPANPDPASEVRTGTQSWEEMYNGYFDVALADEDLTRPAPWQEKVWETTKRVCRPGVALLTCVVGGLFLGRRKIAAVLNGGPRAA